MDSIKVLGVRIDKISRAKLEKKIHQILAQNNFCQIGTVNPEFLVEAQRNEVFREILNKNTLNVCDGVGLKTLGNLFYKTKIERIPGVEVADMICQIAAEKGKSIFFLGGFDVAKIAAQKMKNKYSELKIAGTLDGDSETFSEVVQAKPDIVLVAFGAPKQEYWLANKGPNIPNLKLGGGFGGTFDFWAEKIQRAPVWMQNLGLEWCYRLIKEPKKRTPRIWRAVIVFPFLVFMEKVSRK